MWAPKDIVVTGMNPRGSFNKLHIHWMKHKLESRFLGEVSKTSDMQMILPNGRKQGGTKQPLDEGERGEQKC